MESLPERFVDTTCVLSDTACIVTFGLEIVMKPVYRCAFIALTVLFATCATARAADAMHSLGRYGIDARKVTVSGISSGGYMAVQLGVAYSAVFSGVGVFAAGPFACADAGDNANVNARRALG